VSPARPANEEGEQIVSPSQKADYADLESRLDRLESILGLQRLAAREADAELVGASHMSRSCGGASGLSLGCHCLDEAVAAE
jgi:hypothetical protein